LHAGHPFDFLGRSARIDRLRLIKTNPNENTICQDLPAGKSERSYIIIHADGVPDVFSSTLAGL
jgi:hypothetical protein